MPNIRIASCNMEWMNDWFTPDATAPAFRATFTRDGQVNDTNTTATRAAALIRAVDPDVLAIQEAPSRREELVLFIDTYLSNGGVPIYDFFLGDSGASQKLALLWKPGSVDSAQLALHASIQDLIDPWSADVDGDGFIDSYEFTRSPLVVNVQIGGDVVQMIVMHTKSNFINDGERMWNNLATRQNYVVAALTNRRRIATEGMRLRTYLDRVLENQPDARIIVLGDLNDGPGKDYFESNYLAHNVTDIIVGSTFEPEYIFSHAAHDEPKATRFTAVFDDFVTNTPNTQLLLDHILLSPQLITAGAGLRKRPGTGHIHHEEYEANVVNGGARREDRPSDHRPSSVLLEF